MIIGILFNDDLKVVIRLLQGYTVHVTTRK